MWDMHGKLRVVNNKLSNAYLKIQQERKNIKATKLGLQEKSRMKLARDKLKKEISDKYKKKLLLEVKRLKTREFKVTEAEHAIKNTRPPLPDIVPVPIPVKVPIPVANDLYLNYSRPA